ncbi:MAG: class I SAM-dependent methyltransferase [Candidatus Aminicenantes bacterium]|nr:MAG: class I SAM-dependent methyltransferase [Candidatus Aminicenantes bacterium]
MDKFEHFETCPVCSSLSFAPFRTGTFDASSLSKDHIKITDNDYGKIWDLSRCNNCTHVFANPCPSQEFIHNLYGEVEDPVYQEEAEGRSKNFNRILKSLDKIHPERGNLFDVGAATGILLDISRKQGWHVEGIEPSAWAIGVARDRYNLEIREGIFEEATLPKKHYTVVMMVDFIEHIPHPLDAISIAQKILLPRGTLCLVTPDINSLAARIFGQKWWHYRPGHLGYFSKKSLDFLLRRAGFRIVKARKYSWTFSLHYLLSRKPSLSFLLKNRVFASFWKKIPIKLALQDSFEIYATKEKSHESLS